MNLETFLLNVAVNIFSNSLYSSTIEPIIKEKSFNPFKLFSRESVVERIKKRIENFNEYIPYADGKAVKFSELPEEVKDFILKFIEENENILEEKEKFLKTFEGKFEEFKKSKINISNFSNFVNGNNNQTIVSGGDVINPIIAGRDVNINQPKGSLAEKKSEIPKEIGDYKSFKDVDRNSIIGRDNEIEEIKELLKDYKIVNIYGVAGLGKTTLAKVVYKEIKDNFNYDFVLILSNIDEGSIQSLKEKLVSVISNLYDRLNAHNPIKEKTELNERYELAIDTLNDKNVFAGKKLIIVDNILSFKEGEKGHIDLKALKELFSVEDAKFILTSRASLTGEMISGLKDYKLKPLSLDDSLKVFYHYYKPAGGKEEKLKEKEETVKKILKTIQGNTFLTEILAKALANSEDLTAEELLKRIKGLNLPQAEIYLEGERKLEEFYNKLLGLAWNLLKDDEKARLKKLSLLPANIPIPYKFLKEYLGDKHLEGKLRDLSKKGWIEFREGYIEIHQIVKDYLLHSVGVSFEDVEKQIDYLIDDLLKNSANPQTAVKIRKKGLLEVLDGIGKSLDLLIEEIKEEFRLKIAIYFNNLGLIFHNSGDYDKAEDYYLKALKIREKVLEENHPDLATSYNNLGLLYHDKGDYDKAEDYYLKALNIREKVLEENHPDLATSYNNLGSLYHAKGDYDKAEDYFLKALEIFEKTLGKNHPNTETVRANYLFLKMQKGDKLTEEEIFFLFMKGLEEFLK